MRQRAVDAQLSPRRETICVRNEASFFLSANSKDQKHERANTQCSVCRFDPVRSFITQAGARNGFAEPGDRGPKSGLSRPQPAAETAGLPFELAKMHANCRLFGRDQKLPIAPIFKADSVTIAVSREKDGKLRIVYAGREDLNVVQPDGCGQARGGWEADLTPPRGSDDPP
jgi:hypothetical protein